MEPEYAEFQDQKHATMMLVIKLPSQDAFAISPVEPAAATVGIMVCKNQIENMTAWTVHKA